MVRNRLPFPAGAPALLAVLLALPGTALAQRLEEQPEPLQGVGITEHLNEGLPLGLTFRDEEGREVALGSYFGRGKPVVLNLVYFDCPMLCNVFLDGFTATLRDLDWTPGDQFEIVTVSFDPRDTPEGAAAKRKFYLEAYGRPEAAAGWHFLVGSEENTRALAEAVGFGYRWMEDRAQFAHSAALFLATPDGRLSRYLYGVAFDPQTVRLSLVEASNGEIGSPVDQVLLFCFAYDHTAGRYGPAAMNLMRAFGALCVVGLGAFLASAWRRDARRRKAETVGAHS